MKLVQGEKAQPDSYIRRTALQGALSIFEKIKGFQVRLMVRIIRYFILLMKHRITS